MNTHSSTPTPPPSVWSQLSDVEAAVHDTEQVTGALRAVGNLVRCWRAGQPADVEVLQRDDLASLFEVLAGQLDARLGTVHKLVIVALDNPGARPARTCQPRRTE